LLVLFGVSLARSSRAGFFLKSSFDFAQASGICTVPEDSNAASKGRWFQRPCVVSCSTKRAPARWKRVAETWAVRAALARHAPAAKTRPWTSFGSVGETTAEPWAASTAGAAYHVANDKSDQALFGVFSLYSHHASAPPPGSRRSAPPPTGRAGPPPALAGPAAAARPRRSRLRSPAALSPSAAAARMNIAESRGSSLKRRNPSPAESHETRPYQWNRALPTKSVFGIIRMR
jgi:hypothetical protein